MQCFSGGAHSGLMGQQPNMDFSVLPQIVSFLSINPLLIFERGWANKATPVPALIMSLMLVHLWA